MGRNILSRHAHTHTDTQNEIARAQTHEKFCSRSMATSESKTRDRRLALPRAQFVPRAPIGPGAELWSGSALSLSLSASPSGSNRRRPATLVLVPDCRSLSVGGELVVSLATCALQPANFVCDTTKLVLNQTIHQLIIARPIELLTQSIGQSPSGVSSEREPGSGTSHPSERDGSVMATASRRSADGAPDRQSESSSLRKVVFISARLTRLLHARHFLLGRARPRGRGPEASRQRSGSRAKRPNASLVAATSTR